MKTTTDLRFGEVFRLTDQIKSSSDKVAFLNVMNTSNGGVAVMALEEGQKLDTHAAPAELFVLVLEGEIVFSLEEERNVMKEGDILMLGEGVRHAVECVRNAKVLLCKSRP